MTESVRCPVCGSGTLIIECHFYSLDEGDLRDGVKVELLDQLDCDCRLPDAPVLAKWARKELRGRQGRGMA